MSAETQTQAASRSPWVMRGAVATGIAVTVAALFVTLAGGGLPGANATSAAAGVEALADGEGSLEDRLVEYTANGMVETEFESVDGVEVPEGMSTSVPDEVGLALDPLSEEEAGYARFLALQAYGGGEKVDGTEGLEFLYVQIPASRDVDETRRLAEVVSYDYAVDEAVVQVVDINTGEVTEGPDLYPPTPNRAETIAAMELFLADPASEQLRGQFEEWTGGPLESLDDFYFAGGVYVDPHGGSVSVPECEQSRCVQFHALTWDGMVLLPGDYTVDLSAGVVREVES